MAGFKVGAYATVWETQRREKSTNARISTSRKKQDGTYETDFSGYVYFVGAAHEKAASIDAENRVNNRIRINDCAVTSFFNKEKNQRTLTFSIYDFDFPDDVRSAPAQQAQRPQAASFVDVGDAITEELPFA